MLEPLPSRFRSEPSELRSGTVEDGHGASSDSDGSAAQRPSFRTLGHATVRPISLLKLVPNILEDQRRIWLFPRSLIQGKHWKLVLTLLIILAGLFVLDPHDPGYFRTTPVFHEFNTIVSGWNAAAAMWVVMLSVLGVSLIRRDRYMRHTVYYGVEGIIGCEIVTQVLKGIDRRVRPEDMGKYTGFFSSWLRDHGHWYSGPGSFPSGHMIAAMSIATVFAVRYRHRPWVPWTAYGLAAVVGFSRITLLSHFPSDVFAGAVFGYAICRYVVLRAPGKLAASDPSSAEGEAVQRAAALG